MPELKKPDALEPAEAVLKFLASVASNAEAEFYLRLFRSRNRESFATIAVTAAALEHASDGVVMDLCFLEALDLTPIVVLGLDQPESADGHSRELATRLQEAGLATAALSTLGPYTAITAAARLGAIPLLYAAGEREEQRLEALARMLTELQTHKLIYVRPEGGLRQRGERLSVVNLTTDYAGLLASDDLDFGQRRLLEASRRLIFELVPSRLQISVTSPLNLMRELFTVKGAGTLLRQGARIERHASYAGVDQQRLLDLLSSSFGKAANPALLEREFQSLYLEDGYRGAALLLETSLGGYLSKFAVTREAQGEGIGQDLWSALSADYPALFWRARRDNPIRAWYERQCQGRFDAGAWTVYFRGLRPEQVPAAVEYALLQPADF
jgi:acetylglutamate kinase